MSTQIEVNLDRHDEYSKLLAVSGYRGDYKANISPYITHVKLKKAVRNSQDDLIRELNEIKFPNGDAKAYKLLTREKIIEKVSDIEDKEILSIAMHKWETQGLKDCLQYLLKLGKYKKRPRHKYKARKKETKPRSKRVRFERYNEGFDYGLNNSVNYNY